VKGELVIARLKEVREKLRPMVMERLSAIGAEMVSYARENHPYQDRSFRLTRSINSRLVSSGARFRLSLSASAPYASCVEFGTAPHFIGSSVPIDGTSFRFIGVHPGTEARPFVRPTIELFRRRVEEEMKGLIAHLMEGI
jgi:hypothetical protein